MIAVPFRLSSCPCHAQKRQHELLDCDRWLPWQSFRNSGIVDVHELRDRPSPRFDIMAGKGMAVSIGRIEKCPVMGIKYFVLAHNTIRGAAGAALANAELLYTKSLL